MENQAKSTEPIKRYAFIDASNTMGVVMELLNFQIDWSKLFKHLRSEKWNCESVFFYKGNDGSKKQLENIVELEKTGYIVRTKLTHKHKDRIKEYDFTCGKCKTVGKLEIVSPGQRKSNCDVELSVDAIHRAVTDYEFLIFTGDGDFAYLIEKLLEKNVKVRIISNTNIDKKGNKSFSSRLKTILERENSEGGLKRVSFIDINDWKIKISR